MAMDVDCWDPLEAGPLGVGEGEFLRLDGGVADFRSVLDDEDLFSVASRHFLTLSDTVEAVSFRSVEGEAEDRLTGGGGTLSS